MSGTERDNLRSHGGFPKGLTFATAVSLAILMGLGVWQLQRLEWKRDLLAKVEAARSASVQPLAPALADADGAAFLRVAVACPGLASARFVELQTLVDGRPGVRLISACPTPAGPLLVDRGFVAAEISARPAVQASTTPIRVVGVLRENDRPGPFTPKPANSRFFSRDIPAMATALKVERPLPYMLVTETASNPEWKALAPTPLPGEIANNHLGYAITWFGLAAALAGVYFGLIISRRRNASPAA